MSESIIENFTNNCNKYEYTSLYDLIKGIPYLYENGCYLIYIDSFGEYYDSITDVDIEIVCNYNTKTCNIDIDISFRDLGCEGYPPATDLQIIEMAKSINNEDFDSNDISFNDIEHNIYSEISEKGNRARLYSFSCRIVKLNDNRKLPKL